MSIRCIRTQLNTICGFIVITALLLLPAIAAASPSVVYTRTRAAGVTVDLITVDLNATGICVTPVVARCGVGTCESFRSIMRRTRPAAAINGTFFDTRTFLPTGDIVIDRRLLHKGDLGTAVTISPTNAVKFISSREAAYKWYDYDRVLVAGPTLAAGGRTMVLPADEGFRSTVHYSRQRRAAVGLTYANKLLFVATRRRVYLSELARVMRALNCTDAAALDGGSSIGLYCKGKLIANPARSMTNCLLVYDEPTSYARGHGRLYPPNARYTSVPSSGS